MTAIATPPAITMPVTTTAATAIKAATQ
jgi:hypothetical protein